MNVFTVQNLETCHRATEPQRANRDDAGSRIPCKAISNSAGYIWLREFKGWRAGLCASAAAGQKK
jgi:hypothetical protein